MNIVSLLHANGAGAVYGRRQVRLIPTSSIDAHFAQARNSLRADSIA